MASACSTTPKQQDTPAVVVDVIDRSADKPDAIAPPRRDANPIVVAGLQRNAHDLNKAGESAKAAAILERAIRIQPRNPQLWHELAQVRYTQKRYQQAESLALRSNRYAARQTDLRRANWRLIAESREKLGNSKGAAAARQQAN
jgi:predicted Zn-dependent protease